MEVWSVVASSVVGVAGILATYFTGKSARASAEDLELDRRASEGARQMRQERQAVYQDVLSYLRVVCDEAQTVGTQVKILSEHRLVVYSLDLAEKVRLERESVEQGREALLKRYAFDLAERTRDLSRLRARLVLIAGPAALREGNVVLYAAHLLVLNSANAIDNYTSFDDGWTRYVNELLSRFESAARFELAHADANFSDYEKFLNANGISVEVPKPPENK